MKTVFAEICKEENVRENEPMKLHTYYKIGGAADFYITPENPKQLVDCVKYCTEFGVPYFVLGKGSNVLVLDNGIRGVVICTSRLNKIGVDGGIIYAEAGASLAAVAAKALENSLTGFEFASGIPGSAGGAVFMNAGAYGGEIKDVFYSAEVFGANGIKVYNNGDMKFGYRKSSLSDSKEILLSAEFLLKKGEYREIKAKMDELIVKRNEKQPVEKPSCGSVFKRPQNGFVSKLIDDAGLKGFTVGGASVSEKHAGFIVNNGNAKASDVLAVISHVKKTVMDKFGVMPEEEVKIIGE